MPEIDYIVRTPCTNQLARPYAPDWKIFRAVRQNDAIYKWHVIGWNRNDNTEICWSVPSLDDWRYDLSDAVVIDTPTSSLCGTGANGWSTRYQKTDCS